MVFGGTTCSVAAVTEADCLGIGLAFSNDFFNATVKGLALLLYCTETKRDGCQRNSREDSRRNLNDAISEHRIFLATAVFLRAAGFFAWVLVGHRRVITSRTLWACNGPWRHIAAGITAQQFKP